LDITLRTTISKLLCLITLATVSAGSGSGSQLAFASGETSKELKKMFEQDQADRAAVRGNRQPQRRAEISGHDEENRQRVVELMRQNKLSSGADFYHAAMIMQHGNDTKDYLLAHIFAMAAAQRGSKPAIWLSAASLDRLMQSAGQPQVFATQYFAEGDNRYTMREPMAADIISDSLRKAFDVPALEENVARLRELNADRATGR
jgi:hypothetical protein